VASCVGHASPRLKAEICPPLSYGPLPARGHTGWRVLTGQAAPDQVSIDLTPTRPNPVLAKERYRSARSGADQLLARPGPPMFAGGGSAVWAADGRDRRGCCHGPTSIRGSRSRVSLGTSGRTRQHLWYE